MLTTDNDRFLRFWWEVNAENIAWTNADGLRSEKQWYLHNKGGKFRKWWGNQEYVVNWKNNGEEIKSLVVNKYPYLKGNPNFVVHDDGYYFKESISWSEITSGDICFRLFPDTFTYNYKGMCAFSNGSATVEQLLSFGNSQAATFLCKAINPSLTFGIGNFRSLPAALIDHEKCAEIVRELVEIHRLDWDSQEVSWSFLKSPVIEEAAESQSLSKSAQQVVANYVDLTHRAQELEGQNNRLVIDQYHLQADFDGQVLISDLSLIRTTVKADEAEASSLLAKELISYSAGCMMGRYSLDAPGLIYAHAGNEGFDPSRYQIFPADDDGIVPITDEAWFDDDGANRVREFVRVVWGEEAEAENMAWLAESLGNKASESADDTIRRYLSRDFYKDHLQTYKKRPIYWLFSSGKHKAFEALVYVHRYNAGTLSRMRMEYVVPLQSRMQARIENLDQDIQASSSSAEQKRFQKQKDKLIKQLDELRRFDENLRHYADQRITLDLDDGVKVNYGKFGDLLAEVKAVTGKK